jgi:hypothetical protein
MLQCTGSSGNLPQAECTAWISIFDKTGGLQWSNCKASRLDPCSCSYMSAGNTRGVTCSADGQHILKL